MLDFRLHEGIKIAESLHQDWYASDFVYADTDSVKATSELDFTKFNAKRIHDAKQSGAWANDSKGNPHYMGVFEYEGKYDLFRTLGAKRYCTVIGDKLEITVAGVPKKEGSKVLQLSGGIVNFDFNYVFRDTGKSAAKYDDNIDKVVMIDGHELHLTRNVTILDVDYSMTVTQSYDHLINSLQAFLDKYELSDYNRRW